MALFLALLTFLIVAIVAGAVWMIAGRSDGRQEMVRRRMESVRKAESRGEVSLDLKLVRDELYSNVPQLQRLLMRLPWSGSLQNFINQAGLRMKAGKFFLWTAVAGLPQVHANPSAKTMRTIARNISRKGSNLHIHGRPYRP